jgi:hypothetical protein
MDTPQPLRKSIVAHYETGLYTHDPVENILKMRQNSNLRHKTTANLLQF